MAAITTEQAKWLKEFCGIDLAAGSCAPGAGPHAAGAVPTGPGPAPAGMIPTDFGPAPGQSFMPAPIESFKTAAPQPGTGGSSHDDSHIEFTTSYTLLWTAADPSGSVVRIRQPFDESTTLSLKVPGQGKLIVQLWIEGTQDNQWPLDSNESFTQYATVTWRLSADTAGTFKPEHEPPEIGQHEGGTDYRLDSLNPDEKPTFLSLAPIIVGTSDSTSEESGWNGGVTLTGKRFGAGGGYSSSSGSGKAKAPPKVTAKIVINLSPVLPPKPPPPPEPHGTVTVSPEVSALAKYDFEIGPFKVGKVELEGGSVTKRVYEIFHSLPEAGQTALVQGKRAGEEWPDGSQTGEGELIEVHGYTSNTDSQDHNFELSKKRAEAVLAAFKSLGVPPTAFANPIPHGEWETHDDDGMQPTDKTREEKESAAWRKVVLKMKVAKTFVTK